MTVSDGGASYLPLHEFKMEVFLPDPDSQVDLKEIVESIRREHKEAKFETKVKSKKLVPVDVVIELTIQVSSLLLYDIIKRLTRNMSEKNISPRLDASSRQLLAESIVAKNTGPKFKLIKKSEGTDGSVYLFSDKSGGKHRINVRLDGTSDYQFEEKK